MEEESIQEHNQFKIGQIVWAKVKGFPWWPAKVLYDKTLIIYRSVR